MVSFYLKICSTLYMYSIYLTTNYSNIYTHTVCSYKMRQLCNVYKGFCSKSCPCELNIWIIAYFPFKQKRYSSKVSFFSS